MSSDWCVKTISSAVDQSQNPLTIQRVFSFSVFRFLTMSSHALERDVASCEVQHQSYRGQGQSVSAKPTTRSRLHG